LQRFAYSYLQSPRWQIALTIKDQRQLKATTFAAVALAVVSAVKGLIQIETPTEVRIRARVILGLLVPEGAELGLEEVELVETQAPRWLLSLRLSETFSVTQETHVQVSASIMVHRALSLALDSPSLGSPMASIG
jgi:hypothetical protein